MNLIANHLDRKLLTAKIHSDIEAVCAFTGQQITEGVLKSDLLSDNFTDFEALKYPSAYVSIDVACMISPVIQTEKGLNSLRVYSFLAISDGLKLLKRDDFLSILENPPTEPFIFVLSFSNKKHIAYKARENCGGFPFYVSTDKGLCLIAKSHLDTFLEIAKRWYTIIPGKENSDQQPTYFTKDEILTGCYNNKKISEYGIAQFLKEDAVLKSFRKTLFAEVVCFCLTKQLK